MHYTDCYYCDAIIPSSETFCSDCLNPPVLCTEMAHSIALAASQDVEIRAWLGMPELDFDVGEPCECRRCTTRPELLEAAPRHGPFKLLTWHGLT